MKVTLPNRIYDIYYLKENKINKSLTIRIKMYFNQIFLFFPASEM